MTMLDASGFDLPPIPTKRYFAIGEVSRLCAVKPHVLRYWETEFPQLRPLKRRGNRRNYQRHEVQLIRHIRRLLYAEGYTINGARAQLQRLAAEDKAGAPTLGAEAGDLVSRLIMELKEVRDILN